MVSETWHWVHCTLIGPHIHQSNRAPLGCCEMGVLHQWGAASKSVATAWCYHIIMHQSLSNIPNTNVCHKEFRMLRRQKGVQPFTGNVYLIRWPVNISAGKIQKLQLSAVLVTETITFRRHNYVSTDGAKEICWVLTQSKRLDDLKWDCIEYISSLDLSIWRDIFVALWFTGCAWIDEADFFLT